MLHRPCIDPPHGVTFFGLSRIPEGCASPPVIKNGLGSGISQVYDPAGHGSPHYVLLQVWNAEPDGNRQCELEPVGAGVNRPMLPKPGDSIFVLLQPFLDMILDGRKTLEIRSALHGKCMGAKHRFVGMGGFVYGGADFAAGFVVETDEEWRALLPQHHWNTASLPYARTCAYAISMPQRIDPPIAYQRKSGQIGMAKFEPVGDAAPSEGAELPKGGKQKQAPQRKKGKRHCRGRAHK